MTDLEARPDAVDGDPFERRTAPHDLMAEQSVLGGMLMSRDAIGDVVDVITAADFYQPRHGLIFDAIVDMDANRIPVDAVSVVARLMDDGDLVKVGGGPYVHDLLHAVPTAANAAWYARIVAERAQLRRLIEAGTQIVQYGFGGGQGGRDVADLVDLAQKTLHEATVDVRARSTAVSWDDLTARLLETIENGTVYGGISTGLQEGDELTSGGFKPGELILVAGRPGIGKSVYCIDIVRRAAFKDRKAVAVFSLEMSVEELGLRIAAAETRLDMDTLKSGEMTPAEMTRLMEGFDRLHKARLYLDDNAVSTVATIRARARRIQQEHGLDLVVIDYLQLMKSGRKTQNRTEEVGDISRDLKLLAKEIGVPVVVAAQLNRGPEQRADKRPYPSDLRESGSLEQDADVIILLHREGHYDKESPKGAEAEFNFAKNRHGATDTVTAIAQLHLSRFVDYHPD
ncbi:replicative DNA helicase [Glycomyces artemisiae]|uniref:Replicative DNA helicase n=1 Tax=Glycomyces artemisiae TaxID=1076443 RepID=A0A2T0UEV3_9ACTN|nr:replicative DNA helicase [Glycomyces artemisiae]PRY56475.1 replicative DNA helicase [Glycomyces artemisiae]